MKIPSTLLALFVLVPGSLLWAAAPEENGARVTMRLAQANPPQRQFAEGVLTFIPAKVTGDDTYSTPEEYREIVQGISGLDWTPNYLAETRTLKSLASDVIFRRDVWGLDFAFKPIRMMEIDVPQPSGKMQKKLIWYMVYQITNNGTPLRRVPVKDQFGNEKFEVQRLVGLPTKPIRFYPRFILKSEDTGKEYLDRILPTADEVIARRETGGSKLYNSVEISRFDIPVTTEDQDNSVWGVVTWEDIDPSTDYFSIYIQGLTNAFRRVDDADFDAASKPLSYRNYEHKTLKLNFWRPGDQLDEHEREIRFGVPGQVDYEWIFR